jgi:hypothetical protein
MRKFGEVVLELGYATAAQIAEALRRQQQDRRVIGDILIEMGALTSVQRDEIVAAQMAELNQLSA